MLLNSYNMKSFAVEGVVWPIGLGSTGTCRRCGHRIIADTDPTGLLSGDSDFNASIDGIHESGEETINLDYIARVRSLRLVRPIPTRVTSCRA
jgi:hypothetical protein